MGVGVGVGVGGVGVGVDMVVLPVNDQKPRSAARTKQRCFDRKIRAETEDPVTSKVVMAG